MPLMLEMDPVRAIRSLGIPTSAIAAGDGLSRLLIKHEMLGGALQDTSDEQISELATIWPSWSSVTVQTHELKEVDFMAGDVRSQLDALDPQVSYELRIHVDKSQALEEVFPGEQCVWFITGQAAAEQLSRGVVALDDWLFRDPARPTRLLITDTDVRLVGPLLAVAGGRALEDPPDPEGGSERILHRMREVAVETARWSGPFQPDITPVHLDLSGTGWSSNVGRELLRNLIALVLLYTADRAKETPDGVLRVQFFGRGRVVVVQGLPELERVKPDETVEALRALITWCYDDEPDDSDRAWIAERLQLLQVAVVDLLYSVEPARRAQAFVAGLPELVTTARSSWKAFLADSLSEHTREVSRLMEAIDAAAQQFSERVAEITKRMTDSMLAAVAIVVGSFAASALREGFDPNVFQIGLLLYAGYLAIFPGLIGLWDQFSRYGTADQTYKHQRERFIDALGEDLVEETEGSTIRRARRRFKFALGRAVVIYTIVVLALICAARFVPDAMAQA